MHGYPHTPRPHRARTPVDAVLARLLHAAMTDEWDPEPVSARLLDDADGNMALLRLARCKLLRAYNACPCEPGDRALAALAIALEDAGPTIPGQRRP
jgi:hypothetical protein